MRGGQLVGVGGGRGRGKESHYFLPPTFFFIVVCFFFPRALVVNKGRTHGVPVRRFQYTKRVVQFVMSPVSLVYVTLSFLHYCGLKG